MGKSIEELQREIETGGVPTASPVVARGRSLRSIQQRALGSTSLWLVAAAIVIAVLGSLPLVSYALYPFAIFVTMVHETGHAVMATATGGTVASLQVSPNLSGVTLIGGGMMALIAPAGYLGATLVGAAVLLAPIRYARWVLGTLALVPLAVLLLFHPATIFTAVWAAFFLVVLAIAAWKLPLRWAAFVQIIIGVEAALNATRDLLTLALISSSGSHIQTDALAESRTLFLPSMVWAVLWTVTSLIVLTVVLALIVQRDVRALRRGGEVTGRRPFRFLR